MGKELTFFIAGIVQGSLRGKGIHPQSYRERIKGVLRAHFPHCRIIDPIESNPNSLSYGRERGRKTFFRNIELAARADLVVSFIPKASMGSAIEMYRAYRRGGLVVAITPMQGNWAARFLSHHICRDMNEFARFVEEGGLKRLMRRRDGAGRAAQI